ncbi:M20 aminoacylase family protein [Algicella marina]|uniref:Amidohydrolase n=1 Tax=Algicella marina TaxID=2683284 RepID=A0A6P1SUW1_9RHOB|nr:M20 aminoacylase family protein [Algicella marina]QHQ34238.1 amidohydrolase [Algicella marina]
MPIRNRMAEMKGEITAWRRDLHANPELGYDTHRTSAMVAEKLRSFGCDKVVEGIGRTGVVGLIRGQKDTRGHVVGLRADMDALPITEATGKEYASKVPGKMHACGHDGHTAMLLGAAKYLAETRNFDGSVAVVFQPAEEGGAGGEAMVEDGLIDRFRIREIYGMHNVPNRPLGSFAIRPGAFYAAVDTFEILVTGKGGHAARPQMVVDTTLAASAIVVALQSVVSRNADPQTAAVLSVTSFRTESEAFNVIPERVVLRGTARTFTNETREMVEIRLRNIATLTAEAHGARADVKWMPSYPSMINHPRETEIAADVAERLTGAVERNAPATTGGEDFSYMLQACPGAYIQVGGGPGAGLHHPEYDFNDELIPVGASYWAELVEARMPAG